MVEALVPALLPYLDRPFAMFGHCLGAIVMFEVLRRARRSTASSRRTCSRRRPRRRASTAVPDVRIALPGGVRSISCGSSASLARACLDDAGRRALPPPAVRADFDVAARYAHVPSAPLDAPITTFAGRGGSIRAAGCRRGVAERDHRVGTEGRLPWRALLHRPRSARRSSEVIGQELLLPARLDRAAAASPSGAAGSRLRSAPARRAGRRRAPASSVSRHGPGTRRCTSAGPDAGRRRGGVLAVQLPGRRARARAAARAHRRDRGGRPPGAARACWICLTPCSGIDMGAILMFETARRLRREGTRCQATCSWRRRMAPRFTTSLPCTTSRGSGSSADFATWAPPWTMAPSAPLRAECAAMASYRYVDEPPLTSR